MAEPFVPALFVGRQAIIEPILDWVDAPDPDHRVLSVLGPPGIGKSYLAHRIRQQLNDLGRLALWINLTRDSAIRGTEPDVTQPLINTVG